MPAQIAHPAFTAAQVATMTRTERAYFTDEPLAHAVAYEDFCRQRRIEDACREAFVAHSARAHPVCFGISTTAGAVVEHVR